MKYIKSFNEQRVIGFRYSEPKEEYIINIQLDNSISNDELENALSKISMMKYELISNDHKRSLVAKEGIISNVSIKLYTYSSSELGSIVEDIQDVLLNIYDINLINANFKKIYK